jgi:hypothetical protein
LTLGKEAVLQPHQPREGGHMTAYIRQGNPDGLTAGATADMSWRLYRRS